MKKFRTADGYTLWWNDSMQTWQDNPDASLVDMEFEADRMGWPIDSEEMRLDGAFVE